MTTDPTATTAVVLLALAAVLACAGGRGAWADEARPSESTMAQSARVRAAAVDAPGAPDSCAAVEFWHAAPWPTPAADSVNCLVATLPRDNRKKNG